MTHERVFLLTEVEGSRPTNILRREQIEKALNIIEDAIKEVVKK